MHLTVTPWGEGYWADVFPGFHVEGTPSAEDLETYRHEREAFRADAYHSAESGKGLPDRWAAEVWRGLLSESGRALILRFASLVTEDASADDLEELTDHVLRDLRPIIRDRPLNEIPEALIGAIPGPKLHVRTAVKEEGATARPGVRVIPVIPGLVLDPLEIPVEGVVQVDLSLLAAFILDVWKYHLDLAQEPASIPSRVYRGFERAITTKRSPEAHGSQLRLFDYQGDLVAQTAVVSVDLLDKLATSAPAALATTAGQLLFRHILREAQLSTQIDGKTYTRTLEFEGGYSELTAALGLSGGKARNQVREALLAGAWWEINPQGAESNVLWTYVDLYSEPGGSKGSVGRSGYLAINPSPILQRNFVRRLPQGERALVPIIDPPSLGRSNRYKAAEIMFAQAIAAYIVNRRVELITHGGVLITPADAVRIAKQAGLRSATVAQTAFERWNGEVLQHVGGERYQLREERLHRFTLEGARREHSGSLRGRKSAAKRIR